MLRLELSLLIVVLGCGAALATFEYEQLVIDKVCTHKILAKIDNHYTSILLKCNWTKFIDFNQNKKLMVNEQNFIFYNIEFGIPERQLDPKYRVLKQNLFQNLKIKSLSLRGIGLERIESNAFNNSSFFYATHLDLSSNKLAKIAAKVFDNLPSLEHLNLSNNHMSFADANFAQCSRLKTLDMSHNRIQYITKNQFDGLSSIELLDLGNNNIENLHACTFTNMKIRTIAKMYNPPMISLNHNPIECDCHVFYINRVLKFRLNLTCISPVYYQSRNFFELKGEDPSDKCKYDTIGKLCDTDAVSLREVLLITVFSVVFVLILMCVCCFCTKSVNKSMRIKALRQEINSLKKPKETKKYYQLNHNTDEGDQTKLMGNQA